MKEKRKARRLHFEQILRRIRFIAESARHMPILYIAKWVKCVNFEDLLCGGIVLLDGTVDEDGEVVGGGVDVFLGLADGELGHQLVKNLDAVLVFVGHLGCGWLGRRIGDS